MRAKNLNFFQQNKQQAANANGTKMLEGALKRAKQTGTLIIADRQLKTFPQEIINFNDL